MSNSILFHFYILKDFSDCTVVTKNKFKKSIMLHRRSYTEADLKYSNIRNMNALFRQFVVVIKSK